MGLPVLYTLLTMPLICNSLPHVGFGSPHNGFDVLADFLIVGAPTVALLLGGWLRSKRMGALSGSVLGAGIFLNLTMSAFLTSHPGGSLSEGLFYLTSKARETTPLAQGEKMTCYFFRELRAQYTLLPNPLFYERTSAKNAQ